MKDILIITHFTQVPGEAGNGRFNYIAEKIDKKDSIVEMVTTSFSHRTKKTRYITNKQKENLDYKLTLLDEPGYIKNVSFKRFYSHHMMGINLKKYLEKRKKPDVIYCSIPSLSVAKASAEYAVENNIKLIIDIQDLWPEAFKMVLNIPFISDVIFYPMKKKADYVYSLADEIIAVSQTYVDRALRVNNKCENGSSVYLGTDMLYFNKLTKHKYVTKPEDEFWLVYIGTLGHSYDINSVIDALKILKERKIENIKLIVMGDGPHKNIFENYANEQKIYHEFMGRLDYEKMVSILVECDLAINPIRSGSAGSIINKVGDYAAAGLPVINTQECLEYRELLEKYNAGLNCQNGNIEEIVESIIKLYNNKDLRLDMGINSKKLANDLFNREITYNIILSLINKHATK